MRTTLDIPEELLRDVAAICKTTKRNEAVRLALSDFVRRNRRKALLALRGTLDIEDASDELERAELEDVLAADRPRTIRRRGKAR
jgi:metal-responsive CopG/Arc/MetJ family transcriptional regulator